MQILENLLLHTIVNYLAIPTLKGSLPDVNLCLFQILPFKQKTVYL